MCKTHRAGADPGTSGLLQGAFLGYFKFELVKSKQKIQFETAKCREDFERMDKETDKSFASGLVNSLNVNFTKKINKTETLLLPFILMNLLVLLLFKRKMCY